MQPDPDAFEADRYLVHIDSPQAILEGHLVVPPSSCGVVAFIHGSRANPQATRTRILALSLAEDARVATLVVDLFDGSEGPHELSAPEPEMDVDVISQRVLAICTWLATDERTRGLPIGLFSEGSGTAVALTAAADRPDLVSVIVSRSGRPDLAGAGALARVRAPTLFIVGGEDPLVLDIHRQALRAMSNEHALEVVPGAGHFFREPGTLGDMSRRAAQWFRSHLDANARATSQPMAT